MTHDTNTDRTGQEAERFRRLVTHYAITMDTFDMDVVLPAAAAAYYRGEDS